MKTLNEDEFAPRFAYRFTDGAFQAVPIERRKVLDSIRTQAVAQAQAAWSGHYNNVEQMFARELDEAEAIIRRFMPDAA